MWRSTAQLYHVSATDTFPYQVCAGQQESGSVCTSTRGNDGEITFRDWHPAGVIEYGYAAPDPLHPNLVYGGGRTEVSKYDSVTGQVQNVTPIPVRGEGFRADRTEPILFSPVDPHLLYYAANKLFATRDGGSTWQTISPDLTREHTGQPDSLPSLTEKQQSQRRGAIYSVAASFKNTQTIWAGTDDGLVWITRDGGKNWSNITPPAVSAWSKIAQVDASRFDDDTAYVAVNRFRLDDLHPYVYRTHDGGKSWQSIASNLPDDAPVNAVREDPLTRGLLFAATETAVWMSMDDGGHWQSVQYNLPHTSMRDLLVHGDDLVVATHGRSFWILDDIAPLRQLAASATRTEGSFLFKPATAYRVRRDTNTDTPLPADEPAGENPPDGAAIDYALPQGVRGPVELEIVNAQGTVVRSYASTDPTEPSAEELTKQLIPPYWPRISRPLPSSGGMHRWIWDLHATAPVAVRYEYPIAAVPHETPRVPQGPLAVPGTYTVKLTAGGHSSVEPLTIKMDPRVTTSAADLERLFNAETDMAKALSAVSQAALQAHAAEEQMAKAGAVQPSEAVHHFNEALHSLLEGSGAETAKAATTTTGLDALAEQATALYLQLGQADAAPTVAQQQAAAQMEKRVADTLPQWEQFKRSEIPAMNERLRDAHLPPIDLDRQPEGVPGGGDEN